MGSNGNGKNGKHGKNGKARKKSAVAVIPVEMIPQAHGGSLRRGGTNRGGSGRPPSAIREIALRGFEKALPILAKIAHNANANDTDKIRAIDVLGKYGLDRHVSMADLLFALSEQSAIIWEYLPRELAEGLQERIKPVWFRLKR